MIPGQGGSAEWNGIRGVSVHSHSQVGGGRGMQASEITARFVSHTMSTAHLI